MGERGRKGKWEGGEMCPNLRDFKTAADIKNSIHGIAPEPIEYDQSSAPL